ncbi:MAG: hypothetical protein U1E30_05040 [Rhodoblastus sp.]
MARPRPRRPRHPGGQAPATPAERPGLTPLGPLMVTPDPRHRHGDIDAVEAQLALAKAVREEAIALTRPPAPRMATEHPLIATLIATPPSAALLARGGARNPG